MPLGGVAALGFGQQSHKHLQLAYHSDQSDPCYCIRALPDRVPHAHPFIGAPLRIQETLHHADPRLSHIGKHQPIGPPIETVAARSQAQVPQDQKRGWQEDRRVCNQSGMRECRWDHQVVLLHYDVVPTHFIRYL